MAGNKNQVIAPEFGGVGPRQVLGAALKESDTCRAVMVVMLSETGEVEIYGSELSKAELALLSLALQSHAMIAVNGWESE